MRGTPIREHIDRSQIRRNAHGSEEAHSANPSLWRIGEAEVDLAEGHTYERGRQLWYLASRARERIAAGHPIAAQPMNRRARESKIEWLPEAPPKEVKELEPAEEERLASEGIPEIPGLEGLEEHPPAEAVLGPTSGVTYDGSSLLFSLRPADQPRKAAIELLERPLFDPLILLTITANCVTMAWESPLDPAGTWKASFLAVCE